MQQLLDYLKGLDSPAREDFARRCGTTVGYLRKAVSKGEKINAVTCINIELESSGAVSCECLRGDVRWNEWCALRSQRRVAAGQGAKETACV